MKKLLSVLLLIFVFFSLLPSLSRFNTFIQQNKDTYNNLVNYNLDFHITEEKRDNVVVGIPTLFVHGFGTTPKGMLEWVRTSGPNKIPGEVITFRFADAADDNNIPNFAQLSLGQKKDMLSLLVAFKAMKDFYGDSGWNTYGQSRGAATIVNTLALLNQPVDTWHYILKKSGITEKERLSLLECVKKGVIVLETPMVTTAAGIHGNGKLVINRYINLLDMVSSAACSFLNTIGLPLYSRGEYVPWGEQALSGVDMLPIGLKVLVHYQKNDKDVGNGHDQLFAKKLIQRLGKDKVFVVLGNDGGKELDDQTWNALEIAKKEGAVNRFANRAIRAHNAGPETLLRKGVVNAFYHMHGGPYLNNQDILMQGQRILKKSSLDDSKNFAHHFQDYTVE